MVVAPAPLQQRSRCCFGSRLTCRQQRSAPAAIERIIVSPSELPAVAGQLQHWYIGHSRPQQQ